jgi:23S rRNA (uridine2552-2'-O)-methyltransferase
LPLQRVVLHGANIDMRYNPQDKYFKKAKHEGYRSRAAYKLLELQQRFRLLRSGDSVVDLGAAPGGWLQVAAKVIGPKGKIVGVDLQPIEPLQQSNITLLHGDITDSETQRRIEQLLDGHADCVLSDMAPKLSGIRDTDMARCLELNRVALDAAIHLLRRNGLLLIKSFISDDLRAFTAELKRHFESIQRTKPDATRQGSSEFYFVAKGFVPSKDASGPQRPIAEQGHA